MPLFRMLSVSEYLVLTKLYLVLPKLYLVLPKLYLVLPKLYLVLPKLYVEEGGVPPDVVGESRTTGPVTLAVEQEVATLRST